MVLKKRSLKDNIMSHTNDKLRREFLSKIRIGDYALFKLRSGSPQRKDYLVEGNVVGINYYTVHLSRNLPQQVVAEQERSINLGRILEYRIRERDAR